MWTQERGVPGQAGWGVRGEGLGDWGVGGRRRTACVWNKHRELWSLGRPVLRAPRLGKAVCRVGSCG